LIKQARRLALERQVVRPICFSQGAGEEARHRRASTPRESGRWLIVLNADQSTAVAGPCVDTQPTTNAGP
jgi:hypothetical protein